MSGYGKPKKFVKPMLSFYLTRDEQEFIKAHPKLNYSEIVKKLFLDYIKQFDEEAYRKFNWTAGPDGRENMWTVLSESEIKQTDWNSLTQNDKDLIRAYLISGQHGLCALCGKPFGYTPDNPVLDHNHKTGKIRGVLHSGCNTSLEVIEDRGKHWIDGAREYLSRNGKTEIKHVNWNTLTPSQKSQILGELLDEQHNLCAICGESLERDFLPYKKRSIYNAIEHPVLDHDHKTGKIRGVLHNTCNISLEVIENRSEHWIDGAREYLSRNGKDVIF